MFFLLSCNSLKQVFRDPAGWLSWYCRLVLNVTIQYPGKGKEHKNLPREVTPPTPTALAISNDKAGLRSVFPSAGYRLARRFEYSVWITGGVDLGWARGNPVVWTDALYLESGQQNLKYMHQELWYPSVNHLTSLKWYFLTWKKGRWNFGSVDLIRVRIKGKETKISKSTVIRPTLLFSLESSV